MKITPVGADSYLWGTGWQENLAEPLKKK